MVKYSELKAGHTLIVTGKPHYNAHGKVAVERGAKVMVETTHPAGVTVKTEAGEKISFYFEHGAEKLKATPETETAIAALAKFGKPQQKDGGGAGDKPGGGSPPGGQAG
jgi:hypothetical protein